MSELFIDITQLFSLAFVLGVLSLKLKQPLIIFLILTGILSGPSFLNLVQPSAYLNSISHIGISILLFLVGSKLNLDMIKSVGKVAVITGLGQISFTFLLGFFVSTIILGMSIITSLYVAIAITFSSTIIIVKLLSDKREINSLHGKISLGFLIIQDLFVIFAMVLFSVLGNQESPKDFRAVYMIILNFVSIALFIYVFIKYIAEKLTFYLSKSSELLLIFAIFLATSMSLFTYKMGLGMELGGLIAGVCIASTYARDFITSKMSSIRDFLLFFFFIVLGLNFNFTGLETQIINALVLSVLIIVGNPIIVMILMNLLGYKNRTGFKAGLTVSQISEFSLIFVEMGHRFGHIPEETKNMMTIIAIITITACSYNMFYSDQIYEKLHKFLTLFEFKKPSRHKEELIKHKEKQYDIILFGLGNYGRMILDELKHKNKIKILGVDFNPDEVKSIKQKNVDTVIGDICDIEFLENTHSLLSSKICICVTDPSSEKALLLNDPQSILLKYLKEKKYKGKIVVKAKNMDEVELLEKIGAHIVLTPFTNKIKMLHKSL